MKQDTLTLLTVGNIERMSIEELGNRLNLLISWEKMIATEKEFVDYILRDKQSKEKLSLADKISGQFRVDWLACRPTKDSKD